jgi:hypothetical protein
MKILLKFQTEIEASVLVNNKMGIIIMYLHLINIDIKSKYKLIIFNIITTKAKCNP